MKHITTYTADTLNAAKTISIPGDFTGQGYRRGKFLTEIEVTVEYDGVVAGQIDLTAKRKGSADALEPLENGTFTASDGAESNTYYGSFDSITLTPDATFIAAAGTFKVIVNAGETY